MLNTAAQRLATVPDRPSRSLRNAILVAVLLPNLVGCASGSDSSTRRFGSPFGPRGTRWTILCLQLQGPQRHEMIEQIAETLKRTPGIRAKDVFIVDDPGGLVQLCYGTYYRPTDPKTGKRKIPKRLREDLATIKQLGPRPGEYLFIQARKIRMPTPDVGNPRWALSNVDATYSLQVAVFEPTDDFWEYKEAAAKYCEILRRKGYEAYYHHTDACSMVTVGSFGPEVVTVTGRGRSIYSPRIIAMQEDDLLKYNRLNGKVYRARAADGTMVPVPSRLVKIPHEDDDLW